MNAVFHLVSAAAAVLLVVLLLQMQRQRDLLRELVASQRPEGRGARVVAEAPGVFLRRFAQALAIPWESSAGGKGAPGRILPGVWMELFLQVGITLIRCKDAEEARPGTMLVELRLRKPSSDPELPSRLATALGGEVIVKLID